MDNERGAKEMRAHAELIKRWAEDETMELELLSDNDKWELVPYPYWVPTALYREKPKKKVDMWQWAVMHVQPPKTIGSSQYFRDTDSLLKQYKPAHWKIICRIEGSKIEVEE